LNVDTDIITSIAARLLGQDVILAIIYVEILRTEVIVFIFNVIFDVTQTDIVFIFNVIFDVTQTDIVFLKKINFLL
jgi:hypothetical protein